jgi:hypothetical protein
MIQPLDGPSAHAVLTVTSSAVQEAKAGASTLEERKVVTLQGNQKFYVYFGDGGAAPSASVVASQGIEIAKNAIATLEAATSQKLYVRAVSATATIRIAERA